MKKLIITLSILILLSGCNQQAGQNSTETSNKTSTPNNEELNQNINKTKKHIINEKLNFKLEIPDSLLSYKLRIEEDDKKTTVPINTIYNFAFPTENINWPNKNGYVDFFRLFIYETENWQKLINNNNGIPTLIATTEKYVYAYNIVPIMPKDISINFSEVDKIKDSFELIIDNKIPNLERVVDNSKPQGDG